MKTIERIIKSQIINDCFKGKVIIIYGPRRVGKTTLLKDIIKHFDNDGLYINCDDIKTREELTDKDTSELLNLIRGYKVIVIDEAQRIADIGMVLKRIIDAIPKDIQIIATGSSSFDLSNKTKEPLTGRSVEYKLYPFSLFELKSVEDALTQKSLLFDRILYGLYPDIVLGNSDRKKNLHNLTEQYLYKDLLSYNGIRKPEILEKIVKYLARNVGSLISYTTMANSLDIAKQTVENYVKVLEQAFIIYQIRPFHKSISSEMVKKRKIYFVDTGVLNMLLEDMSSFVDNLDRNMKGHIWENFVFNERIKFMKNNDKYMMNWFFWRTTDDQELDMIEKEEQNIKAFEIKWNINNHYMVPKKWRDNYDISVEFIDTKNFFDKIWKE